jgi:hypothetical protein
VLEKNISLEKTLLNDQQCAIEPFSSLMAEKQ